MIPIDAPTWRWIVAHRRILVGLGVALLLASAFIELSEEVMWGAAEEPALSHLDRAVLVGLASMRRGWLTTLALDVTALGSPPVLGMVTLLLAWAFLRLGHARSAALLAISAAGAAAWTELLKRLFDRPRPELVTHLVHVSGLSYPSGHSLGSAAVYATIALLLAARSPRLGERVAIGLLGAALILAVGASRVYLGVHYPTDVLAGDAFGAAWALLVLGGSASLARAT